MIGRPGCFFFPLKGFRCETIIIKIHFNLFFFHSALRLNVTKDYILDVADFKTLVTTSPSEMKEALKMYSSASSASALLPVVTSLLFQIEGFGAVVGGSQTSLTDSLS